MAVPAGRDLRLMAWNPADPPTPGLLEDLENEWEAQILGEIDPDIRDQIIQITLHELTQMGLVSADEDGRYRLTTAGHKALSQPPADAGPGGPAWVVTLYRPACGLPWLIDQVTEVTETDSAEPDLACPAGVNGSI